MLFLTSKTKPKARADLFLSFDHLWKLIQEQKDKNSNQLEVPFNVKHIYIYIYTYVKNLVL